MRTLILAAALLLLAAPAWAQGPVINQSTCSMTVDAPQTNVECLTCSPTASELTDLAGHRFYVAPTVAALAALTTPTFSVAAPLANPPAGASATASCKTLALGAWVWAASAFDASVPPNEGARTVPFPFVLRDDVSPAAPSNARMP